MGILELSEVACLPVPGDNCAVATRQLEKESEIQTPDGRFRLSSTILEGHRFAVSRIPARGGLLSWGLPFGKARREIQPGEYVCNERILEELKLRRLRLFQPSTPNFSDWPLDFHFEGKGFRAAAPEGEPIDGVPSFLGYHRGPVRGVGTRNFIILLSTNALSNSYVRMLARRFREISLPENVDGVVAVAHTEGAAGPLHNLELLLRTLAGFFCHPNVEAVLCADAGPRGLDGKTLFSFMDRNAYPWKEVRSSLFSPGGDLGHDLQAGESLVRGWLEAAGRTGRSPVPASSLRLALQCGGSDAFSGISANPLVGWVAKEVVRSGGSVNLAETDELIGAEAYMLSRVKDLETAERFLRVLNRFKAWAELHGHTAESNPSGGNRLRGLYNITLKSLGAAMKRHPEVRLDKVIDYAERLGSSGFHFMDSPGNDLESVAGQVASGCNLITFTTGNGSITNFPFVPTIKVVTTTARYRLLSQEMDVNAGVLLEGKSLEDTGCEMFDLLLRVASGERTRGEQAGHSQVSIWRDWQVGGKEERAAVKETVLSQRFGVRSPDRDLPYSVRTSGWEGRQAADRVGLILPASLCASEITKQIAEHLNQKLAQEDGLRRFVALPHTEGCGVSAGESQELSARTLVSYLNHPLVTASFLLEHGCETLHNEFLQREMERRDALPKYIAFASIQLDGGIAAVVRKAEGWFRDVASRLGPPAFREGGLEAMSLGLCSGERVDEEVARASARAVRAIVGAGGRVFLASGDGISSSLEFVSALGLNYPLIPNLHYGEAAGGEGLFVMDMPRQQWVEQLSGLAAGGAETFLLISGQRPLPGHPLVPSVQVGTEQLGAGWVKDADVTLKGASSGWPEKLLGAAADVVSGRLIPRLWQLGANDFQLTRGYRGISM